MFNVKYVGVRAAHLSMTSLFGQPFARPHPMDAANPEEHVSPFGVSGELGDPPRAQDT